VIDSISNDIVDTSTQTINISQLIVTSMMNSALIGINGLNPPITSWLGQVIDKEHC
ncbi:unnamed protein product, partial [Rotaria sordida]